MLFGSSRQRCNKERKEIMRTLTDSELDAVAGGASLALNATTAGVAGLSVGGMSVVMASATNTLAAAVGAGAAVAFGAGTVTLAPLTAKKTASIVLAL
jgi:hypothetical protein